MSEDELYGEQDWIGYRSLALDIGAAEDTLEQACSLDNCFEAFHVTRMGDLLAGSPRVDVERL